MHGCWYALSVLKPDGNSVIVFFRYNKSLWKGGGWRTKVPHRTMLRRLRTVDVVTYIALDYPTFVSKSLCDVHVHADKSWVYFVISSNNSLYRRLFSDISMSLRQMAFLTQKVEGKKCILFLSPYIFCFIWLTTTSLKPFSILDRFAIIVFMNVGSKWWCNNCGHESCSKMNPGSEKAETGGT
jgi:hypothetical protein